MPPPDESGDPWEEKFDEDSGLPYFVHRVTGESAWDRPGDEPGGVEAIAAPDDLAELGSDDESVYDTTTESHPNMWGEVVDSKPDEEEDDGGLLASLVKDANS